MTEVIIINDLVISLSSILLCISNSSIQNNDDAMIIIANL